MSIVVHSRISFLDASDTNCLDLSIYIILAIHDGTLGPSFSQIRCVIANQI